MKTFLTPQQKKALSLQHDRRNSYGERGANSRFSIARNKANDLRRVRRTENAPFLGALLTQDLTEDGLAAVQLRAVAHPPRRWKKHSDISLKRNIEGKLNRRAAIAKAGGRRKAKITPISY